MAISVYTSLLIKDYQRTKGAITGLRQEMRELAKAILEQEAQVAALGQLIRSRDKDVDLDQIHEVRTFPKVMNLKFGRLTALIVECLREAKGEKVGKEEVVFYVMERIPEIPTRTEQVRLRVAINKALGRIVKAGQVMRHHPLKTSEGGTWSLPVPASLPARLAPPPPPKVSVIPPSSRGAA